MMAQVNAGRVRFVGRGEYNNSTQYYVFDLISYNGNSYYAKVDTIGHLPTDTTYWQLVAEKGNVGPIGLTGNGISSIEKTSTSGLVDTYTITYTNGNTTTFDVSNGNGIDRIEKTATVGNKDTYTIYFTNGSTTTYEVSNGEVTREELEEEVDRLSMIYNAFPSTTGEGEEPSINGTAEVPFKEIGLKGNTSQESTTGKNLFSGDYSQFDSQGGTGSTYGYFKLEEGTQYTLTMIAKNDFTTTANTFLGFTSTGGSGSGGLNWVVYASLGTITKGTTLTKTSSLGYVSIYSNNANTLKQFTDNFDIQLEKGSTATEYEPYTNGPAPNPDYPYPVNVVTGDNEVKVEGKNLFNKNSGIYYGKFYTNTGEIGTDNDTFIQTIYISVNSNTQYTISGYYNDYFRICEYDKNKNFIQRDLSDNTTTSFSIITTAQTKYVRISCFNRNLSSLQLEQSSTATSYEPYKRQTYPINLGSMELCKIRDYQDYLYKENGIWYLNKQIGKATNSDFEQISAVSSTISNDLYAYACSNSLGVNSYSSVGAVISNIFTPKHLGSASATTDSTNVRFNMGIAKHSSTSQIIISILKSYLTTGSTSELDTFLTNNNFYFYYIKATPTYEEITDTTLIEQLDNLEKAYSYDTQTNISQTNQDKPFIISYEAILSLKNVLNS